MACRVDGFDPGNDFLPRLDQVDTIFEDGQALFGPVVVDPPTGEAAERLWALVCGWREFPHLYELQRPKRPADIGAIAEAFRPYLEARDWITIQKETP